MARAMTKRELAAANTGECLYEVQERLRRAVDASAKGWPRAAEKRMAEAAAAAEAALDAHNRFGKQTTDRAEALAAKVDEVPRHEQLRHRFVALSAVWLATLGDANFKDMARDPEHAVGLAEDLFAHLEVEAAYRALAAEEDREATEALLSNAFVVTLADG